MRHHIHFVVAILCLMVAHYSAVLQSGKCDERTFDVVDVSIEQIVSQTRWDWLYVTDAPEWSAIDHAIVIYTEHTAMAHIVMNDSRLVSYSCEFSKGDGYFIYKCPDGHENVVIIRYYILYFREGKAIYVYRCTESDGEYINADMRFVAITEQHDLTEDEKNLILDLDSKAFEGALHKLPWKLP